MGEDPDFDNGETMLIVSLDNLAHRYHMLPSEALNRATTFDLHVLDISSRWMRHQQEIADASSRGLPKPPPKLSTEVMMDMIKRAREQ